MLRSWLQRFMYGRYGSDRLNHCLLVAYLVLLLAHALLGWQLLYVLSLAAAACLIFRALSRNLPARQRENARFLKWSAPAVRWLRLRRTMSRDKEHRYFKCPHCAQYLRVPKGKGKITVTCRSCGTSFQEKS